jgi:hypothetical protein
LIAAENKFFSEKNGNFNKKDIYMTLYKNGLVQLENWKRPKNILLQVFP